MMQYLKSVTSIHPRSVIKMHATNKKFYFGSLCYVHARQWGLTSFVDIKNEHLTSDVAALQYIQILNQNFQNKTITLEVYCLLSL